MNMIFVAIFRYKTIARFDKNLQFDGPCVKFHETRRKKASGYMYGGCWIYG